MHQLASYRWKSKLQNACKPHRLSVTHPDLTGQVAGVNVVGIVIEAIQPTAASNISFPIVARVVTSGSAAVLLSIVMAACGRSNPSLGSSYHPNEYTGFASISARDS